MFCAVARETMVISSTPSLPTALIKNSMQVDNFAQYRFLKRKGKYVKIIYTRQKTLLIFTFHKY